MDFGQAIVAGFKNYAKFSGRSLRSEYWYWTLFIFIVSFALMILDFAIFPASGWGPLNTVWSVVTLLPAFAISARRLHDIDRTGWWLLLVPTIVGWILLIYWACIKGTTGPNRFGPDPLMESVPITQPG